MVKKPSSAKKNAKTVRAQMSSTGKLFLLAFLVTVIASIGFIRYQQSKLYFRNLTYKEFSGSKIGLSAPKSWENMEHGATTMLHDPNVVNHDSVASILIMTYRFIPLPSDGSLDMEEQRQQLQKLASDLEALKSAVTDYSDVHIVTLGGKDAVMAHSNEDYSYVNSKKRALNVFVISSDGEIKRVMILTEEDAFERNKADMQKVAESVRWLKP